MDILNGDILVMIFEKLDRKSIINTARVCKSWYDIIASTSILANKVTLSTSVASWKDGYAHMEQLEYWNRKLAEFPYRNFKLTSNYHFNAREKLITNKFLENVGHIEKLHLNSFSSTLMTSFLNFSASTLTHLIVTSTFPDENFNGCIELSNLEYLKLVSIDSVLTVFRCKNLRTLVIENCRDPEALEIFLENCNFLPKLKKLKTFEMFWELEQIDKLPFQLKELEVSHLQSIDSDKFQNFLLSQAKSLKKLIIIEPKIRTTTINFVLDNLKNLNFLKIFGSLWSISNIDINLLPKNLKIETLELTLIQPNIRSLHNPELNSSRDVAKILMKCQNLKNLKVEGSVSNFSTFEGTILLPRLKNLKVEKIEQYWFWSCFEFKCLENFTLETLDAEPQSVKKYLRILSKIRTLRNLQVNEWLNIEDNNIMNMRDMMIFFRILSKCFTFSIKKCKILPLKFLNYLPRMKSKSFKLVRITVNENELYLDELQEEFKDESFQTVFKLPPRKKGLWENEVEFYEEDEDDESYSNKIRSSFRRFMGSISYPN